MAYFKPHLYLNYQKHPISLGLHLSLPTKKIQKCVNIGRYCPTASSEARTVCIVKLCVCISTALHSSKYTNFLDGMNVVESCIA